jgi:hypothetical protein
MNEGRTIPVDLNCCRKLILAISFGPVLASAETAECENNITITESGKN